MAVLTAGSFWKPNSFCCCILAVWTLSIFCFSDLGIDFWFLSWWIKLYWDIKFISFTLDLYFSMFSRYFRSLLLYFISCSSICCSKCFYAMWSASSLCFSSSFFTIGPLEPSAARLFYCSRRSFIALFSSFILPLISAVNSLLALLRPVPWKNLLFCFKVPTDGIGFILCLIYNFWTSLELMNFIPFLCWSPWERLERNCFASS